MSKWKYFKDSEVEGLQEDFVFKLDRAREYYGRPLIITSGFRSVEDNEKIGGVPDSAHVFGMAVDLRVSPDDDKEKMLWAFGAAGFMRLGVYDRHIHLDTDKTKPWPGWWKGKSK